MKPNIYIDGQEGTTGLQIYERLGGRQDINLLRIDPDTVSYTHLTLPTTSRV